MNFLKRIVAMAYCLLMAGYGILTLAVVLNVAPAGALADMIDRLNASPDWRIFFGLAGITLIVIGVTAPFRVGRRLGSGRLITFHNPDGEVTVALSAIENFVKRVAKDIPGIKDVRSGVKVSKKGIKITGHVAITAGTNIPEVTENIQMTVKGKVQDMIGTEENIDMTIHISDILKDPDMHAPRDVQAGKGPDAPFQPLDQAS